jgi:SAM-dependent methyltransferase
VAKPPIAPLAAPGYAVPSRNGLRQRLSGWLLGDHLETLSHLQQEIVRLQAALGQAQGRARDELLQVREQLGAKLAQQDEMRARNALAIKALEQQQARQQVENSAQQQSMRGEIAALHQSMKALADSTQLQLDEYGRVSREQAQHWASVFQQLGAGLQGQIEEFGRLFREQEKRWVKGHAELADSLQRQLDEYGRLLRDRDERWFTGQEQMIADQKIQLERLAAMQQEFSTARQRLDLGQQQLDAVQGRLQQARIELHAGAVLRGDTLAAGLHQLESALQELHHLQVEMGDPIGADFDYTAFEDRFRGAEKVIRERQSIYLPLLKTRPKVLDLGCGRGEMLELLREAKVDAQGIELNVEQVLRCRGKGLDVLDADFRDWLPGQPDRSFGAVVSLQVVEHLPLVELRKLIREAERVLAPGGILLLETVNPHCPEAMEWFYIDPTHQRPVYPEMLELLLQQAGFKDMEIRFQVPCSTAPPDEPANSSTGADYAIWGFKR